MLKKIKKNNGITQMDLTIAVIVIVLFVSVITTLFYNVYIRGQYVKRLSEANGLVVQILESISSLPYDDIVIEENSLLVSTLLDKIGIEKQSIENSVYIGNISGYTITVKVEKYTDLERNKNKSDLEDVIKIINVKVEYKVSDNVNQVQISTVRTK